MLKIAFVTTPTNPPCGIGQYCDDLVKSLNGKIEPKMFYEGIYWKRNTPLAPLARSVLEWNPDLIHIQHAYGFFYQIPEFESFLNMLRGQKIVITLHEIPTYQHQMWYNDSGATFIFPHKIALEQARKMGFTGKHEIIPWGATLFEPVHTEKAREELKLPQDRLIIVQPGFYSLGAGMKEIVEAMSLLRQYNPLLVFAGGVHPLAIEEDRRALKKAMTSIVSMGLNNNIVFVGKYLSEEELNKYISAADIIAINHRFVYPAISSSAIGKRVMSSGKPCIFGDDPRLADFEDGKVCLKVKAGDPRDIAEKIKTLINNQALQRTLGENAKAFAKGLSWEEIGNKHLELYNKLCQ
jgi:glycosyltransferase involved in cell wall biosynthesis